MRPVALPSGSPPVLRLRRALAARPAARIRARVRRNHGLPRSHAARLFWSERAWCEYGAVPAMAQTSLALIREGSSLDELDAVSLMASDEIRHTELSRDLADAFGGYVEEVPPESGFAPHLLAQPYGMELAFWIAGTGCVGETVSLELMRLRLEHTTHPLVRSIISGIMKDEAMHTRLGWLLAEMRLPELPKAALIEVAEYTREVLRSLPRTFTTKGLPSAERRRVRKMRAEVARRGLGCAPPDEIDARFDRVIDELIRPRLRALGVPV